SSRNLRNITQVSRGRRSMSVESPLSFRITSRADLIRLPSCCAVVGGSSVLVFFVRGICRSGGVQEGLERVHGLDESSLAAEVAGDLDDVAVAVDGRHFQRVRENELSRAVLGVLVEELVKNLPGLGSVAVEEVLAVTAKALGALATCTQRPVE